MTDWAAAAIKQSGMQNSDKMLMTLNAADETLIAVWGDWLFINQSEDV